MENLSFLTRKIKTAALETICIAALLANNISRIENVFGDTETRPINPIPVGINWTGWNKDRLETKDAKVIDKISADRYYDVAINPCYEQNSTVSSSIDSVPSMSYEYMRELVKDASSKNLNITIKPLINAKSQGSDQTSRSYFSPKNIDEWFEDYTRIYLNLYHNILDSAKAQSRDIDINIGTEIDSILYKYPERFDRLIDTLHSAGFQGRTTYSIEFASELDTSKIHLLNNIKVDYIGIDFYVSMHKLYSKKHDKRDVIDAEGNIARQEDYVVDEGPYEVLYYFNKILASASKPVKFTEAGVRSIEHGHRWPNFDSRIKGNADNYVQLKWYQNWVAALKLASSQRMDIIGTDFWITDNSDITEDIYHADSTGYSYFRKPAEKAIKKYILELNSSKTQNDIKK